MSQPIGKGTSMWFQIILLTILYLHEGFWLRAGGRDRGVTLFFHNCSTGFTTLSIAHIKQTASTPEIFTLKHILSNFYNAFGLLSVAFLSFSVTLQDTGKKGT